MVLCTLLGSHHLGSVSPCDSKQIILLESNIGVVVELHDETTRD